MIFLISSVSAVVFDSSWQTGGTSATITNGQSINFTVSGGSMNPPSTIYVYLGSKDLYTDTIYSQTFSKTHSITPSMYSAPGTYTIEITGTDAANNGFGPQYLTLTVNPIPPAPNTPPTLSPISNQQVNENTSYSYQSSASDSDGDTLTYSLPSAPSWLSINSSTGLITGTSPGVSSDTNYTIEVGVSDGVNPLVTTSYALTVKNVPVPPTPDTTPPTINLSSPANNQLFNSQMISFSGLVYDNVGVANVSFLLNNVINATDSSGKNNTYYNFTDFLPDGTYNWSYQACDTSDNCASSPQRTFIVDTTSPTISFGSSTSEGNLSQNFIYVNLSASDSTSGVKSIEFSLYNSTGLVQVYSSLSSSMSMNVTNLANGIYYLNATAEDNAGNVNSTNTIKITLDTTPPSIHFTSPTPSNDSVLNQTYIPVEISSSDSLTGVAKVEISLYKQSSLVKSATLVNSPYLVNFTGLQNGVYYLNATSYDFVGNMQKTSSVKIVLNRSVSPVLPTPSPTKTSSNTPYYYSYSDVYSTPYEEQTNKTSPGISLGPQSQSAMQNASSVVWIVIVSLLAVLIVGTGVMLVRLRNNGHKNRKSANRKTS